MFSRIVLVLFFLLLRVFDGNQHIHLVAGVDEAGDTDDLVTLHGDRPLAFLQHSRNPSGLDAHRGQLVLGDGVVGFERGDDNAILDVVGSRKIPRRQALLEEWLGREHLRFQLGPPRKVRDRHHHRNRFRLHLHHLLRRLLLLNPHVNEVASHKRDDQRNGYGNDSLKVSHHYLLGRTLYEEFDSKRFCQKIRYRSKGNRHTVFQARLLT